MEDQTRKFEEKVLILTASTNENLECQIAVHPRPGLPAQAYCAGTRRSIFSLSPAFTSPVSIKLRFI